MDSLKKTRTVSPTGSADNKAKEECLARIEKCSVDSYQQGPVSCHWTGHEKRQGETFHFLFASLSPSFLSSLDSCGNQTQVDWPMGTAPSWLGEGTALQVTGLGGWPPGCCWLRGAGPLPGPEVLTHHRDTGAPSLPSQSPPHIEPHWHLSFETFTWGVSNIGLWFLHF